MSKISSLFQQYVNENYQVNDDLLTKIKSNLTFQQKQKRKKFRYLKLSLSLGFIFCFCLIIGFSILFKPQENNPDYLYNTDIAAYQTISFSDAKKILNRYEPINLPSTNPLENFQDVSIKFKIEKGLDLIVIDFIDSDKYYSFKSNLPYAFSDIVEIFEEKSNKKLSHEFIDDQSIKIIIDENTINYQCQIDDVNYNVTEHELIAKSLP